LTERREVKLSLVREHKNAILESVSRKTATMVIWDTDRPTWTVRIPNAKGARKESIGKSRLVQVAVSTGKELSSTQVGFLPRGVHYFPGSERVIFKHSRTLGDLQVRTWDLGDNTTTCLEGKIAGEITGITPVGEQELVGLRTRGKVHSFVRLRY
jgi:hypothetical protein